MQACETQIFGYLWHLLLFSNAFFKAKMWQKAEEYIPKYVCQHSTAQVIVTGKIRNILHVNFGVCSDQSNACIQNQDVGYTLAIFLLLKCLP